MRLSLTLGTLAAALMLGAPALNAQTPSPDIDKPAEAAKDTTPDLPSDDEGKKDDTPQDEPKDVKPKKEVKDEGAKDDNAKHDDASKDADADQGEKDADAEVTAKAKADAHDDKDADAKAKADVDANDNGDVDAKAKAKTDVDADAKAKTAKAKAKAKGDVDADANAETDVDAKSKADVDAKAKADVDADTDIDAKAKTDIDAKSKTKIDARSKTNIDQNTDIDINARAKNGSSARQRGNLSVDRNTQKFSIDSFGRFTTDTNNRLVVNSIVRDSVFASAGLRQGDVLVSVLNQPVASTADFRDVIINARNVDRIPIVVLRNNRRQTIYVNYREVMRIDNRDYDNRDYNRPVAGDARLGVHLDSRYQRSAIVESVDPGSPADRGGVRVGDWITRINGQAIRSPAHLTDIVSQMSASETIDLEVSRRHSKELQVTLDDQPNAVANDQDNGDYSGPRAAARVNIDNDNNQPGDYQQGRTRVEENRGVINRPLRTRARNN